MNLKLDLSMVNTILMIVVLILVIVACVRRYRENFDTCHIPCNADGEGEWTEKEGTQFTCGGPECADVSTIDAAFGRGAEFGLSGPMIDAEIKEVKMTQMDILAGILYKQFKYRLTGYDADADETASTKNKNIIETNYINFLKKVVKISDAKLDDEDSKHVSNLKKWITVYAGRSIYDLHGFNTQEVADSIEANKKDDTKKIVTLDIVNEAEGIKAFEEIILTGVENLTTNSAGRIM